LNPNLPAKNSASQLRLCWDLVTNLLIKESNLDSILPQVGLKPDIHVFRKLVLINPSQFMCGGPTLSTQDLLVSPNPLSRVRENLGS